MLVVGSLLASRGDPRHRWTQDLSRDDRTSDVDEYVDVLCDLMVSSPLLSVAADAAKAWAALTRTEKRVLCLEVGP